MSIDRTEYGTWKARWRDPVTGKQKAKSFRTKREAHDFLVDMQSDIRQGDYIDPRLGSSPFETWAMRWHGTIGKLSPSTQRGYEQMLFRHIIPFFRGRGIGHIDYADVETFIATKLQAGHSPRQVRNMVSITSVIMKTAIRGKVRRDNPAADHSIPDRNKKKKRAGVNIPTMDQIKLLVAHVPHERYVTAVWLLAYAGLRPSELCGLKVRSVDFMKCEVHIDTTLTPVHQLVGNDEPYQLWEGSTKTSAGDRTVPIPRWLAEDIAAMLADRKERRGGGAEPTDWLFLSYRENAPLNRDKFRKQVILPALKSAGLPTTIRTYDLRHAHASMLIEQGANLLEVAQRMGHTDPSVTLRIYGHLMRNRQDELTDRLDQAFGNGDLPPVEDNEVIELDTRRRTEGDATD